MRANILRNEEDSSVTLGFADKIRRIEVTDTWGDGVKLVSKKLNGVCKHRTGKKLYPVRMEFHLKDGRYVLQTQYCCINKQAVLVGWLEDYFSDEKCSELAFR